MAGKLDGQVALVTGGSRGIGRAICLELAHAGAKIAVNYNSNKAAADEVVAEIEKIGGKAASYQANVANFNQCGDMVKAITKDLGPVRVLVNNAGTTADRTLMRMSLEEWTKVIDTNVNGLFNVTRHVWPVMAEAGGGQVVCIGSVVGEMGRIGLVNYGTSKAAVDGFVRAAAREGARFKIYVNGIAPGFIDTDMISGLNAEMRHHLQEETVLKRLGTPGEIAIVVRFLVTESTYITGQVLNVNGGMYI